MKNVRALAYPVVLALAVTLAGCGAPQPSAAPTTSAATASSQATDARAETADVTRVSYLGPAGTYTEEATKLFFGTNDELMPQDTVAKALDAVADGSATYAVIPQENTLGGPVTDYIDALLKAKDVSVVGEVVLPIRQTLMGLPGTDLSKVTRVVSHKQGLAQSADWLSKNLPNAERVEAKSTAAAAQEVADGGDTTSVAIAAPGAAGLYNLEILQDNVSQSDANKTRFYVVSKTANSRDGYGCAAFVADIHADDLPAILEKACTGDTRLVCVHDRPEGSALGVYKYIIELERDGGFATGELERLQAIDKLDYLGSYSRVEG